MNNKLKHRIQAALLKIKNWHEQRKQVLLEDGILHYLFNTRGYVLVIVLMASAMLITFSSEFLLNAQTNINYMKKFKDEAQAEVLAETGLVMAQFLLRSDSSGMSSSFLKNINTNKNIDSYNDIWAMDFPALPLQENQEGEVKIYINDEQAKINLSVLANETVEQTKYYAVVQRFFMNMGLPMDMADSIIDWVDVDDSRFPYGAETFDYYSTLTPSYQAKNEAFDSIDELLMVKYITPEIYYGLGGGTSGKEENLVENNTGRSELSLDMLAAGDETSAEEAKEEKEKLLSEIKIGKEKSRRLSHYFRVNGYRTDYTHDFNKINLNTASYRVLSALTDDMTDDIVTEIIRRRLENPFDSIDKINDLLNDEDVEYLKSLLGVKSSIFSITAIGTVHNHKITMTAVYNRSNRKLYYVSIQ